MLEGAQPLAISVTIQVAHQVTHRLDPDGFFTDPDATFALENGEWFPVSRNLRRRKFWTLGQGPQLELAYVLPLERNLPAWQRKRGQEDRYVILNHMEEEQARTAQFCEEWASQ